MSRPPKKKNDAEDSHVVQTEWWLIDLPEDWQAEQDDETIEIFDPDELGCLSITTLINTKADDLAGLIEEVGLNPAKGEPVQISGAEGLYFECIEDGDYLREWYVHQDSLTLVISYACDQSDRDMDAAVIDQMLDSIQWATGEVSE